MKHLKIIPAIILSFVLINNGLSVNADSSIGEENGQLYCYNDSGEKESGWKEINGHSYYFRSSDKTAICGKAAEIGDVVYKFNDNGICKGKFTGYATQSDGSRVYYKDGVQHTA